MPWMVAFAGTGLRIILEEGFREAAVGDDGRTFSEPTIITKTILGDEIIIRTEQIAFVQHMTVDDWNGFGSYNRRLAAEFLGVDLAKEWAADDEYLQKKTKAELLAFGKKSGIFADKKIKDYLQKNFNKKATLGNLKKSELVDVFLKSGVNLVGRVPDEILRKAR